MSEECYEGMVTSAYKLATDFSWVDDDYGFYIKRKINRGKRRVIFTNAKLSPSGTQVILSYLKVPQGSSYAKEIREYVSLDKEMVLTKG